MTHALTRAPEHVWEGNALAHLIALHAVDSFAPKHWTIDAGIAAVDRIRNEDGGVPFIAGQEVFVTALTAVALARAGADRSLLLRTAELLAASQHPGGGWGYSASTRQTDADDTARCMEALQLIDPHRYRHQLAGGTRFLLTMAGPDGGFPTHLPGHPSDVDMTAGAVIALAPGLPRHRVVIDAAADALVRAQQPDGTYRRSWTISVSSVIERVVHALHAVGPFTAGDRRHRAVQRAIAALTTTQNGDGGWGRRPGAASDVLSTAQSVPALARHGPRVAVHAAIDYLLGHQHTDGSFTSPPDQVGPRPFPFDYPVLACVHALNALTAVTPGKQTSASR
ncbi:prenyltransferase/squalene oxidase repeat-containing protein [Streptomyces sp. NPDC050095]|uniref:prenyltransferase/squalene oxidase repeat-containing protein n=1 Tax=unclassified Streptomyces TaxID=2593676 RepID=UPI00344A6B7D